MQPFFKRQRQLVTSPCDEDEETTQEENVSPLKNTKARHMHSAKALKTSETKTKQHDPEPEPEPEFERETEAEPKLQPTASGWWICR